MKNKLIFLTAIFCLVALQVMAQKVGIGTTTPQSTLDVEGGLTVGEGFSGTHAAPTNGAIFEGGVGIGINTLNSAFNPKLEVGGMVMGGMFLNGEIIAESWRLNQMLHILTN